VVQPTYDDFYVPQGSSTNITNSFLRVVVAILTTNVSGKEIVLIPQEEEQDPNRCIFGGATPFM
jgi:hypothetical protein